MARYTLKTYCGAKQLERFENRSANKLLSILSHPRHDRTGQSLPFGEHEDHANRFEIMDSLMGKIFVGNIEEALAFARSLK